MYATTHSPQPLKIDQNQARQHLEYLGYESNNVYLRFFYHSNDPRKNNDKGRKCDRLDWEQIERYQTDGRGVYVVVNGALGGHEDKDITSGAAIFCEWDDRPIEDQLLHWETVGFLEPTFTIYSGDKSAQPYWVLDKPLEDLEQWRTLQQLLIKVMKADPANKNPSRVFRLAGGWHVKPGREPKRTQIVQESGQKYSYQELKDKLTALAVPESESAMPLLENCKPRTPESRFLASTTRYEDISLPVPQAVPIEVCLAKESRNLLQSGQANGSRNQSGAALARDLIGTANYLRSIGQDFDGDEWQLFTDYCHRCPPGGGWNESEWLMVWKSAQSDNPSPSCRAEGVETCVKAWYWNNHVKQTRTGCDSASARSGLRSLTSTLNSGNVVMMRAKTSTLEAAVDQARVVLQTKHTELTENIELEKVRQTCGMSGYDWERKIIKPLKKELDGDRFRLDLLNLLAIDDEVERIRQQAILAPKYQMSTSTLERALQLIKQRTTTPTPQWFDLDTFFDQESQGLKWTITELLPVGETVILAGPPKSGKTLLAIDCAFAVATGESSFLKEAVTQGRVLIVSVDESAHSTKAKLIKRGFRRSDASNVQVMTSFDVRQIKALEERLEVFRPTLVVIDSLKRITHGQQISENSAEFADNIYTIKELLTKYGTSGILIHHTSKNQEALGVDKIRGSSAISGAVWGTWQLDHIPKPDPNNKKRLIIDPKDPKRILSVFSRDAEGQQLRIELDLEDHSWVNQGGVGDSEEWLEERRTLKVRIIDALTRNAHKPGCSGREIIELMGMTPTEGRSVYSELNRMISKRLINCHPAPGDKRYNIYSLPKESVSPDCQSLFDSRADISNVDSLLLTNNPHTPPLPPRLRLR
ncbi:AAA family ATPase, partial [Chlorogloea sp. CCALA 695]|uniref:AAA family ATPase n=1 Tax=Chlorogloea sp. CCALA 695 TaxID=2107693 RepID=UPI000D427B4B